MYIGIIDVFFHFRSKVEVAVVKQASISGHSTWDSRPHARGRQTCRAHSFWLVNYGWGALDYLPCFQGSSRPLLGRRPDQHRRKSARECPNYFEGERTSLGTSIPGVLSQMLQ